ncbi:MAG TPA: DUF302 domain-containing protein, partial [Gemmatimonadaceae bacterium]|nr:DUF302 domain-containing protein [Gemmatimonadaceae bacterium]
RAAENGCRGGHMDASTLQYGMSTTVDLPYERAVERTREALSEEGFGVLSEIDVRATLRKKLDVEFPPYVILGACNPPFAHQALTAERNIGLLLPCNVVVYATDEAGKSVVAAVDPEVSLGRVGNEELAPLASDVKVRLRRVLDAVTA